jgi:organic hydroperoxide reductase OsmC/OhrA
MMGTFAAMLAKSRIPTPEDRYQADVAGEIEAVNGVLKIVRIKVHYALKLAADKRKAAEEAFDVYLPHCPAAASVMDAIHISHDIAYEEL